MKNLKNTPIYVKPQFSSSGGLCRVNVLVGLRNDPGKQIDSATVEFPLPSSVVTWDLTANYGTIFNSPGSKVIYFNCLVCYIFWFPETCFSNELGTSPTEWFIQATKNSS